MELVSASHGVLGSLLGKLAGLLAREGARLKGVQREIRSLSSELTGMHAALQKYTMLQDPDIQVKVWISLVRELAYDIEDVVDKFIHQLGNDIDHGGFKEFFHKMAQRLTTLGSRYGIANEIIDLKARVKEVKRLKTSYKLDDVACSSFEHLTVDLRLSALFTEEDQLVGIDGPRDYLLNWMTEEDNSSSKHPRVLSIVGFGGLGKTTLANEVYRRIQSSFECYAFVSVSQKPDINKIIKDLVSQVPCQKSFKEDIDTWDVKKSITKLRELLQDKRYLIVIDDIWSIQAWDCIKCAFPKNNRSSRIISTTRVIDVGRSCCQGVYDRMHEMEALSESHSKKLFFQRIFGSEDDCPDILKEVSDEILKKCGGLPLAITSISGLLANKPVVKEEWDIVRRSIGSAMEKDCSLEGMNNILSLSYNDLRSNLKTCLLYLSMFPEDYKIEREKLVRRWTAEGFISEERGRSQHEIAESYFYELINKSMVQAVDITYDGKARACRVHDMMLELIISKSTEDNFVTVLGSGQTSLANRHGSIRRLSIQHIDHELASLLAKEDLSHVRSLTVTASDCIKLLPKLVEFEVLRVLDFEGCEGMEEYDMKGIEKLFQLKYLSLRGTGIQDLPSGVVLLHDLETLDLRHTKVYELPPGIVQLIKLKYLFVGTAGCYFGRVHVPDGIGNMKNLRVISGFNLDRSSEGTVEQLGNLASLEEVCLQVNAGNVGYSNSYKEKLLSILSKLGSLNLHSVWICCYKSSALHLEFLNSLFPLPSSLQRLRIDNFFWKTPKLIAPGLTSSLADLTINLREVTEEDLGVLGEMPSLLSLQIAFYKVKNGMLIVKRHMFPYLKKLCVIPGHSGGRADAAYFKIEEGALPKLEKLEVPFSVSVAKPYGFNLGMNHLPCLKDAKVSLDERDATSSESMDAAAVLRNEAKAHPNHPRVIITDGMRREI